MKVLIKQVTIIDPTSSHNKTQQDILINNGFIENIHPNINESADMTIQETGLHISPGWIDVFAHLCDPGYEYKESLETGAFAAAAGGFTTVMVIPNTKPAIDNKAQAEYIFQKSKSLAVNIVPIGAVTKNTDGKELAEMYDMQNSGVSTFSDGLNSIQSAGLLIKALQYVKSFEGVIIQIPDDKSLVPHGLMNEGIVSTRLGLPGKPMMSEELVVARDIKLARYTGSKLHFTAVTSAKSLEYIRRGKEGGISVTCSVTPYHLFFCDEDLMDYDTNLKVNPPLRTRADMMSLRKAVEEGAVDCIATHHLPHEYDSKMLEFEYAKDGMIGLETAYCALKTVLPRMPEQRWVELLSLQPAAIFNLPINSIEMNKAVVLTIYQPNGNCIFTKQNIRSKSTNSPFLGKALKGRVAGILNGDKLLMNQ
ncbi:MAG: dihydroorotase [Chitinophagaceae bacterium]